MLGNLIADLFNPEAVSHLDIFRLGGRFDLSALRRVRVNISMDLANGCLNRQAISAIKAITGDDGIPLEGKFKDVEFGKVQCKLLFGSNHRLSLAENDDAFLNRLVVIPFQYAIAAFLREIKNNRFETIFLVTLFTGLREGEILGLTWDCINLDTGIIFIDKQLQLPPYRN